MTSLYRLIVVAVEVTMAAEMTFLVANARWMQVFLVAGLMAIIALSLLIPHKQGSALIPVEILIFLTLFVFATLFLGEVRDFYRRIWWWDLALHGCSGLLLGLLGFLVLYLLNESEVVNLYMRPAFLALFAFFFAFGIGGLWEIVEFTIDHAFGTQMQKPMLGDPSGLTDTMWDLIIDAAGAIVASGGGWLYIRKARDHGKRDWLARFAARYPHFFAE
ncbi:membrane protein [Novosphingobium malaysiense]|uniref:Membrane protein n=1 Tax=Novosphingobium malaysiense TaxID=1348853 RepID=A0A0B1ZWY7_9SPHN|nr:membrane protein [Novosphingobium malaysiense]